jgi:hypothetical protein
LLFEVFFRILNVSPKQNLNIETKHTMKKSFLLLGCMAVAMCLATSRLSAADAKDYQVSGPVLEVNPSYIVVQKGEEKWQIAVDPSTKGDKPKVGDKVTVKYTMTASSIQVKKGDK